MPNFRRNNILLSVWIPKQLKKDLEAYLNKYLAGATFSEQFKNFLEWFLKARAYTETYITLSNPTFLGEINA